MGAFQMSDQSFGPNPVDAQVGYNVMAKRTELGFSQGLVAEQLGYTLDEYHKRESGMRRFGAERLSKLARLMDVPANYFFLSLVTSGEHAEE
jgi:transcriptional regulator with XRE-family HTH domain